ncbi:MAG: right-handed parallel beta-helix repeat-containing protein, partial [Planctomycetes bacterium]|nr:right-handed parallel beta-helix repeat-containing protein [Planctomycetota bacterium]
MDLGIPLSLCVSSMLLAGETIHVPADLPTIQGAIDIAADGDSVLVAAGEYRVRRTIFFYGKAIAVRSEAGPEATVIRMDNPEDPTGATVVAFDYAEGSGTILEGFTITGGGSPREDVSIRIGGGIRCTRGSPVIRGNRIVRNGGLRVRGGGIGLIDSAAIIEGNLIEQNTGWDGAGIFVSGAPEIRGNRIRKNATPNSGGGLCVSSAAGAIEGNSIIENRAQTAGGVEFFEARCRFRENVIAGNRAWSGGGIGVSRSPSLEIDRCTIAGNSAFSGAGIEQESISPPLIVDSIIWDNESALGQDVSGIAADRIIGCATQDPPPFLDPANRDYRLTAPFPVPGAVPFSASDGPRLLAAMDVDLGPVRVGEATERSIRLANGGKEALVVRAFAIAGSASFAIDADPLPWEIPAGGIRAVEVRFAPAAPGEVEARIDIDSNDPASPSIRLIGRGTRVIRVPDDASTIAQAVELAQDFDDVLIGPGTYEERIEIRKPIGVRGIEGPSETSMHAEGEDPVIAIRGLFLGGARIEGLCICDAEGVGISIDGACATVAGNWILRNGGRGIEAKGDSVEIRENRIEENRGGVDSSGYVRIIGNRIIDNHAEGIYAGHRTVVDSNEIEGNRGGRLGGGVYAGRDVVLRNNLIARNTAEAYGGGLYLPASGDVLISGDRIVGNEAPVGGGIYVSGSSFSEDLRIRHVTVVGNRAAKEGAGIAGATWPGPLVYDSIVWGNVPAVGADPDADGGILRNCIETDPGFIDPEGEDLRIAPDSPCVDVALDPDGIAGSDFEGDPRGIDGDGDGVAAADIGADEFAPAATPAFLSAARHDFGGIAPGEEKIDDVPLWNAGIGDLEIRSIAIEGPGSASFAVRLSGLPASIPSLSRLDVPIAFHPGAGGPAAPAYLVIDAGEPGSAPARIELAGRGTQVIAVPGQAATLDEAVAQAFDGDRIVVAAGFYRGGQTIERAIAIEAAGPGVVIDAEGQAYGLHVRFASAVVRGFVITGAKEAGILCEAGAPLIERNRIVGNIEGVGIIVRGSARIERNAIENNAGGILCEAGSPIIWDNDIRRNTAESGGGIRFQGTSVAPMIIENRIEENVATDDGGGICGEGGMAYIAGNRIAGNTARWGAALRSRSSSLVLDSNEIASNASERGAAVELGSLVPEGAQDLIARGNRFQQNEGPALSIAGARVLLERNEIIGCGAGIEANGQACEDPFILRGGSIAGCEGDGISIDWPGAEIEGVRLDGNGGAGAFAGSWTRIARCILVRNRIGLRSPSGTVEITASTIAANEEQGVFLGGSGNRIENSIIWGNGVPEMSGVDPAQVLWSDVEDPTLLGGEGTISRDPLFVDPAGGDFALRIESPCIDGADPFDADPDGSRADMGALPFDRPVACGGENLLCERVGRTAILGWDPCAGATAIRIVRNGKPAASLDPGQVSFIEEGLALGRHVYEVLFEYPDRTCPTRRCEVWVPLDFDPLAPGTRIRVPTDVSTIQDAIDLAAEAGCHVEVEPGEYILEAPIRFRGEAVELRSTEGPERTVLRPAPGVGPAIVCDANEGSETIIRGFTIRGAGYARSSPCQDPDGAPPAAAIQCDRASPRIEGNWILGNSAAGLVLQDSWAQVIGNRIGENETSGIIVKRSAGGGGSPRIEDNEIFDNAEGIDLGAFGRIAGNRITGNRGAGIRISGTAGGGETQEVLDNVIAENAGAGILGERTGSAQVLIAGNSIVRNGGGPADPDEEGGIVWSNWGGSVSILGNTIVGNRALRAGAGIRYTRLPSRPSPIILANSIVWGNLAPWGESDVDGVAEIAACLTGDIGLAGRNGNLFGDPHLLDPSGDPHLLPGSPCIDAGDMRYLPVLQTDIDGDPRVWSRDGSGRLDIGADESVEGSGSILLAPWSVSFPDTLVGDTSERQVILASAGSEALEIRSVVLDDPAAPFRIDAPALPIAVDPGDAASIPVTFLPVGRGSGAARILVRFGDPPALRAIPLSGEGIDAIRVPEDAATIGEAMILAADGDRILVGAGTYEERVVFPEKKSIALIAREGPSRTIIDGSRDPGPAVEIPRSARRGTRLEGFLVTGGSQ